MAKVWQEFYCAKSGGGCGGFITVRINIALDGVYTVVCPECKHEHQRGVKAGHIVEEGRYGSGLRGKRIEKLCPTMAAYSKEPQTKYMKKHGGGNGDGKTERNAGVIKSKRSLATDSILRQSWLDRYGERT